MKLPKYYCPHCKRFKKDNFIDREHGEFVTYCRGCGTTLTLTETLLHNMIENFLENETTEKGRNNGNMIWW